LRNVVSSASNEYTPAIGVWGTSADDVYAWYGNRIFHRKSEDGGPPTWVLEHEEDAAAQESFYVFGAGGSSSDEVWFVGSHGVYNATNGFIACSTLIRRTPDGYTRVMDHALMNGSCRTKAGSLPIMIEVEVPGVGMLSIPSTTPGWATSVDSPRPGTAVAIVNNTFFVYVDTAGAGMARHNAVQASPPTSASNPNLQSVWVNGDRVWLSGWGLVVEGENRPDAWARGLGLRTPDGLVTSGVDGGATLRVSSTALNGAPLDRPLYQVRGTSNDNLWAVGPRYALHKTP
jgi:hypothetical protein